MIPSVVGGSLLAGAVSVPLVLSSGALSMTPDALVTASASASAAAPVSIAPSRRRSATSSLSLAGQPAPGGVSGSQVREVTLQERSGPPGSKVVVTGYCMSAVDTDAAAGIGGLGVAGAVTRPLTSSGTFTLTLRAPRTSGDIALTVACLSGGQSSITWHLAYRVTKTDPTSSPGTPSATSAPTPTSTPSSTGGTSTGGTSTSTPTGTGQSTQPNGQQSTGQQNAAPQGGGSTSSG
jgi:hypothetical protein